MAQSYKTLKENFVSGLPGGSVSEVNYVTAIAPVRFLLFRLGCTKSLAFLGSLPGLVQPPSKTRPLSELRNTHLLCRFSTQC